MKEWRYGTGKINGVRHIRDIAMVKKILVVDDKKEICEFMEYTLSVEGYEVFTACSGKEALINLREISPDLIILALVMTGMSGTELCEKIKKDPFFKNISVLIMTDYVDDNIKKDIFMSGADDYIIKSFDPTEIISRVKFLLESPSSTYAEEGKVGEIIENCKSRNDCRGCEWNTPFRCFWFNNTVRKVPPTAFNPEDILEAAKILSELKRGKLRVGISQSPAAGSLKDKEKIMAKKILVVDDEKDFCETMNFLLSNEGYKVSVAFNGEEALSKLRDISPDLMVLDILMPGMNGYEVCRKIRKDPIYRKLPVLMLTGITGRAGKLVGFDSGTDDYITKPFYNDELLTRIRNLLTRPMNV